MTCNLDNNKVKFIDSHISHLVDFQIDIFYIWEATLYL